MLGACNIESDPGISLRITVRVIPRDRIAYPLAEKPFVRDGIFSVTRA